MNWWDKEQERIKKSRKILRRSEQKLEQNRHFNGIWLVAEETGFANHHVSTFIGEIPPNQRTGMHRHANEAAVYILSGKGYSIIGEEKIEWEEGDTLLVPTFEWHQHFNPNNRPVRFLAAIPGPWFKSMGFHRIEQRSERSD